ncbi:hypothetical protein CC86DRAFT_450292 [Ophiobolus disseminans]|uniref:Uncharacterized protein n=1 Tax=Ophiobolus disseminans TaxID=1469910 RepID=A0A6A6ZFM1_9PLEO|nr:hypothetical protein CC86DRAFT_450292 [Ophiobolus disseminans]
MSKRSSEGDVLLNRVSLGIAKHQKLLASWMGTQTDAHTAGDIPNTEEDDDEFKQDLYGPDRLGVGGIVPKDMEDGKFTRRNITSDDKLLAQLIGKKKAKAHIATKQHTARLGTQQQPKHGRQAAAKKEDSEDEDEGRAAAFTSKKRKTVKAKPASTTEETGENEQGPPGQDDNGTEQVVEEVDPDRPGAKEQVEEDQSVAKPKSIPSRGRTKPKSYLDELLAERSKKKNKKGSSKAAS